jgi:hypothetical protein
MQKVVRKYLKALEAGDATAAAALFTRGGWVQSPFLGRLPVRDFVTAVATASGDSKLTVYDVLVSAEGHTRAVAYYLYDWSLKDGSRVAFDCADVFNFDPETGHIASIVLVYDTHLVRDVVRNKYPGGGRFRLGGSLARRAGFLNGGDHPDCRFPIVSETQAFIEGACGRIGAHDMEEWHLPALQLAPDQLAGQSSRQSSALMSRMSADAAELAQ